MGSRRHIYRRTGGTYYFRWPIPDRLSVPLGCNAGSEIRFSLRTYTRALAVELSARHWLRCCDLLRSLDTETGVTVKDLTAAIEFVKDFTVSQSPQKERLVRPPIDLVPIVERFNTASSDKLREIVTYLVSVNIELFVRTPGPMAYNVCHLECTEDNPSGTWELHESLDNYPIEYAVVSPEILSSMNAATGNFHVKEFFTYDPGFSTWERINDEWRVTQRLLLYPEKEFPRTLQQLLVQKKLPKQISDVLEKIHSSRSTPTQSSLPTAPSSILLSVAIANYHKKFTTPEGTGKDRKLPCTQKTAKEMGAILATFLDVVGDKPVTEITAEDHHAYLDVLGSLPLHYRKRPDTRNLTAKDAAALARNKNLDSLSATTYNNYLSAIQTFVEWLWNDDHTIKRSILNAKKRKPDRTRAKRIPFEPEHLKLMFESDKALEMFRESTDPYRTWLPLLALFTGARLNELCQLLTTDIGETDGVAYIDFNTDDPEKSLKTDSSHRRIPIHSQLLELGFMTYVTARRNGPRHSVTTQLFPELTKTEDHNFIRKPTWWFNDRFLDTIGLKQKELVFHSFRHTVSSHLRRQKHLREWLISGYIGHDSPSQKAEWERNYSTRPSVSELVEVAESIVYPIDFTALAQITPLTYRKLTTYKPSKAKAGNKKASG